MTLCLSLFPSYHDLFLNFFFLILITFISESPCTIQYWTALKYHLPFYITLMIISKVVFSLCPHISQKYILVYSFIKSKPSPFLWLWPKYKLFYSSWLSSDSTHTCTYTCFCNERKKWKIFVWCGLIFIVSYFICKILVTNK